MISAWTSHLGTEEERQKFKNQILASRAVLQRLTEMIEMAGKDTEYLANDYDLPNWDYKQADNNGFKRCVRLHKTFTTFDQKDNKNGGEPIRPE